MVSQSTFEFCVHMQHDRLPAGDSQLFSTLFHMNNMSFIHSVRSMYFVCDRL